MITLTPKQKAKELIEKYQFVEIANYTSIFEVKQCALIAVDEIYQANLKIHVAKRNIYWDEVKQEIEKL
jgi:hypothetical protein